MVKFIERKLGKCTNLHSLWNCILLSQSLTYLKWNAGKMQPNRPKLFRTCLSDKSVFINQKKKQNHYYHFTYVDGNMVHDAVLIRLNVKVHLVSSIVISCLWRSVCRESIILNCMYDMIWKFLWQFNYKQISLN